MTNEKGYLQYLDSIKQEQLNSLIKEYEVYASSNYADIIVPRDRFISFINSLTNIGLVIESVNWWCNATEENTKKYGCPHGYGGPITKFGWFSEMSHDFDEIKEIEKELFEVLEYEYNNEIIKKINDRVIEIIENKQTIKYGDGTYLIFKNNPCLTPGLWLLVPENWKFEIN